ncbi:glucosylceramidase, putative, partial [Perkinsus marinus ATCC 50983]
AYERLGVPIWAITQQNEPSNPITLWASCFYTPEAQLAFIRDYLGPAMKAANTSTKLFFNDDNKNFLPEVSKLILGDKVAAGYVAGAAVHWYTMDQYPALEDYKDKYLDRYMLISTEATNGDPFTESFFKTDWDRAMHYAHGTIVDFVHGGSTAFIDWVMTGPGNLVSVSEEGKITVRMPSGVKSAGVPNPGQAADGIFPAGIEAMAAINPARTEIAIVVICDDRHESNATIAELPIEVDLGGGRYSTVTMKNVEQRSVTTVVLTSDKF